MPLGTVKAVPLLKAGKWKAMNGKDVAISAQDLNDIERNFQTFDQAPMVLGHVVKSDTPAHGWPERLYQKDETLFGDFKDVPATTGKAVNDRQYRKISLSLQKGFKDLSGYVMRHVGLLGASLPAVEGLGDVPAILFSENHLDVDLSTILEFSLQSEDDAMKRKEAIELLKKNGVAEVLFAESVADAVVIALAEDIKKRVDLKAASDKAADDAKAENDKLTVQLAEATADPEKKVKEDEVPESVKKANALLEKRTEELAAELVTGRRARFKAALDKATEEGRVAPAEVEGYLQLSEAYIGDVEDVVQLAAEEGEKDGKKVTAFESMVRQVENRGSLNALGEMGKEGDELSEDQEKQKVIDLARKQWAEQPDLAQAYKKKEWVNLALEGAGFTVET